MKTFLWVSAFLAGAGIMLGLFAVARFLGFLFGGNRRLARARPQRRSRSGITGAPSRVVFFFWGCLLLVSSLVVTATVRRDDALACTLLGDGSGVACSGFPGSGFLSWLVSVPAALAVHTERLITVLRAPRAYLQQGMETLPPGELALGLIGPLLLLLAWIGFVRLLGDIERLWRGD